MELNENLSELIGAIIGDGNIYNKRPSFVEICGHPYLDKYYLSKYLSSIISNEINYIPKQFFHAGSFRIRINNKKLVNWLLTLGIPAGKEKCRTVKIPERIFKSKNLLKKCIRGIFDTDGFIYWDKRRMYKQPYPRLGMTTCSENLFEQLVKGLKNFGFENFYIRKDLRSGANNLEFYGIEQLNKWKSLIGTSNPKHKDKLLPQ